MAVNITRNPGDGSFVLLVTDVESLGGLGFFILGIVGVIKGNLQVAFNRSITSLKRSISLT
ncbi:MAG: hypothetical protein EAX86_03750 [Candidatus Heimdallarchaeota archaeon]|nr:hypothetical protein [Candidatus Heimdallarchaeota archaeon]